MEKSLITSDPRIMFGNPVISGTRITVDLIMEKLAAGETVTQILNDYPHLTYAGIMAAIAFAADTTTR